MIELAGQATRWLHLLSGAGALGALWWLSQFDLNSSHHKLIRLSVPFLLLTFALTGLMLVYRQAEVASGSTGLDEALRFSLSTQFGQIWLARIAVALILLGVFFKLRPSYFAKFFVALLMLQFTMAFVGHGAASDTLALTIMGHGIHVTAASLWLGGLLFLGVFVFRTAGETNRIATAMRRFSGLAINCMILIAMSGIVIAALQIRSWPALFGTNYGESLLRKLFILAGVLGLAGYLRWRILDSIESSLSNSAARSRISLMLGIEVLLGLSILWLAASLAVTPPGQHEQIVWPFEFRIAEQVTWLNPEVRTKFWQGVLIFGLGLAGIVWIRHRLAKKWYIAIPSLLLVGLGFWASIEPLTVPAFADSYRRSAVPFHALSIANGKELYVSHCVECHGIDANGNGPRSVALTKRPADLTAPHLGDHTPGDLYWWLTHGIKDSEMPAFANLSEEERWDLVNFLHVLASGYEARVLRTRFVSERPWLGAPDFNFIAKDGASGSLRDFRDNATVLLVLCADQCAPRLNQLDKMMSSVGKLKLKILAVPINQPDTMLDAQNITLVTDGNREITSSYMLFRRTIENPRSGEQGALPIHMEFLLDRFGYVRARWLPEDSTPGWGNLDELVAQIEALNREPRIKAPPDEHLH